LDLPRAVGGHDVECLLITLLFRSQGTALLRFGLGLLLQVSQLIHLTLCLPRGIGCYQKQPDADEPEPSRYANGGGWRSLLRHDCHWETSWQNFAAPSAAR